MHAGASSKWLMGLMFLAASAAGQTAAPPVAPPAATPVPSPSPAGVAAAWKPFQELAFLTGSWSGGASVGPRFGGRVSRFGPELLGGFFTVHGSTFLAADEGGKEETLEEEGWFAYDRGNRKYVASWYFSNGVTGTFDVELLPDGVRLVSRELVNYEPGTRARILFQKRPDGDVAMNVELAAPGKDFVPWLVSALKKK